jgi:DNA helicase-2/ATP-dependent DNA helicase PcrA
MKKLVEKRFLSAEQVTAIEHPLEPVAIIAGAGTGKTEVMSQRVKYLIESNQVDPASVLGLTFTNKAAGQLNERIARSLGEKYREELPTISTYHSFARQLLIDYGAAIAIEPDHKTLSESARAALAFKVISHTKHSLKTLDYSSARLVEMVLAMDDLLAEHLLGPDVVKDFDHDWILELQNSINNNESIRRAITVATQRAELLLLVDEFRDQKLKAGALDFADQMRWAHLLLQSIPDIAITLKAKYQVVLLDEYQDTSVAQQELLLTCFGQGHPVTAVGDPLQSIYSWRGASANTTRSFPNLFKKSDGSSASTLTLRNNYRSGQLILTAANNLIQSIRNQHEGSAELVQANLDLDAGKVRVGLYETEQEEIRQVTKEISNLVELGAKPESIAVLGRTTSTLLAIHNSLVTLGIPATLVGVETISRTPEAVEILSLIEAAHDPLAGSALARLLISPRVNIGDRDLNLLGERARELARGIQRIPENPPALSGLDELVQASLSDALFDLGNLDYSSEAKKRFNKLAREIQFMRTTSDAIDAVWRAVHVLGLDIEVYANTQSINARRSGVLEAFIDLVQSWSDSADDPTVAGLLSWIKMARRFSSAPAIEVPIPPNAVQLLTIHRAKGLEWPHVFIPAMAKNVFPTSNSRPRFTSVCDSLPHALRGDSDSLPQDPKATNESFAQFAIANKEFSESEELRLAYVALTRAEQTVMVSAHWWGSTQLKARGPSDFYNEIALTATEILQVAPVPERLDANPHLVTTDEYRTKNETQYQKIVREVAGAVQQAKPEINQLGAGLSDQEKLLVERWDQAINWVLREPIASVPVSIPAMLTASRLVTAIRSPEVLAQSLIRPMPSKPSRAAIRGTNLHAKIERFYKDPALISLDELNDNTEFQTDEVIAESFIAFEKSRFAQLAPVAIEWGFQLPLDHFLVPGRVDAVFKEKDEILLVDWKSGKPGAVDDLQLSLYRLAWSYAHSFPLEQIKAIFVFLPSLDELPAENLQTKSEILELLKQVTA